VKPDLKNLERDEVHAWQRQKKTAYRRGRCHAFKLIFIALTALGSKDLVIMVKR